MRLLLVEDNRDLVRNMFDYLEPRGYVMDCADEGFHGLQLAELNAYDAMILDVMLPGMDGLSLCRRLREKGIMLPVLMLTARDSLEDKIAGLESGADDYVVKPFMLREVEVRLKALVRRAQIRDTRSVLRVEDLYFDPATMKVWRGERKIDLPPIPFKLLELLMRNSPRVLSRDMLERSIWGDSPPDSDALRAHMHILRNAIDRKPDKMLIKTQRGVGYQIDDA